MYVRYYYEFLFYTQSCHFLINLILPFEFNYI